MGEPITVRRKRLAYRSAYRGTRESDLVFRRFADRYLADLSDGELDAFEAILDEADQDVMNWILGRTAVPARHNNPVFRRLAEGHRPTS